MARTLDPLRVTPSPAAIRRYVRQVVDRFAPDEVILFGSRAYGVPGPESDVDLLVVMPARDPRALAIRIRLALPAPFPLDLLVRTPEWVARRVREGESFTTEITTRGRVLYEKGDAGVGAEGRSRSPRGHRAGGRERPAP